MSINMAGVDLLTQKEAAELIKKSESWFEHKRWEKKGIPYIKVGGRVFYDRKDLLDWVSGTRFL